MDLETELMAYGMLRRATIHNPMCTLSTGQFRYLAIGGTGFVGVAEDITTQMIIARNPDLAIVQCPPKALEPRKTCIGDSGFMLYTGQTGKRKSHTREAVS